MKPSIVSIVWTSVAILAGISMSLTFHFFWKKKHSSRNNVVENPNHTTPVATAATASPVRPLSQNYEVFLNFRGADTRKTFTDHLYQRLVDVRVCAFRDNKELHVGEEISPSLLAAIQTSKISIPIISQNYANSKWCLCELVQILKCRETMGQIVIPIFYHVDPSDVRHQTGAFGKGFSLLKKKHSREIIQGWKEALEKVASLKVLELNDNTDGYEGKLVKQVVEKVLTVLNKTALAVPEHLVGVEEQAKKIMEKIELQSSNDVQVVLIYGMGGIGKTTLAKFLYNQLSTHFHFCSFLENVRETSPQQLQKQLISNIFKQDWPQDIYNSNEGVGIIKGKFKGMKVLIVLDDVDSKDRFNALVGECDWLGLGSVLIVTTRNKDVFNPQHVKLTYYELEELDFDQSFQLFCKHALQRKDLHCGDLEPIAQDIVSTTGGLPLAIEVIGHLLSGKGLDFWMDTSKKLKRIPNKNVLLKLKISYEALTYEQKNIFLDISCLFPSDGEFTSLMYMWDSCNFFPRSEIEVLKSLCLIKVRHGNLTMHDQLRLLGREIVRQESGNQPGRCKILWDSNEALEVMQTDQGSEEIEALNLALDKDSGESCFTSEQFERFKKLRVLQLKNANLIGNFKNRFLNLRWLQWHGCPSNFTASGFRPKNLVVLKLSESSITENWGGWSEMKNAENLKVLELRECSQLKATPDFSGFKQLEFLDLSYCKSLSMIHPSIGESSKSLRRLKVDSCGELELLPKELGKMEELRELVLNYTPIREVPIEEGFMTKLTTLSAMGCEKLIGIPDSVGSRTKLKSLNLIGCKSLTQIPKSIGNLSSLSQLFISNTNIKTLPDSIGNLSSLAEFVACDVHGLTKVPKEIDKLTRLEWLDFNGSPIYGLPNFPVGLKLLSFSGCSIESLPNLSCLTNLISLYLYDVGVNAIPELLPSSLENLYLTRCKPLRTLPKLSSLKSLSRLHIEDCPELMEINALEEAQSLRDLEISDCRKLSKLSGGGDLLMTLWLCSCDELEILPDLSTFKNLRRFSLIKCNKIVEIQGLDTIECLTVLRIYCCSSLERTGDLSGLKMLPESGFGFCPKLRDIDYPYIDNFASLKELCLFGGSVAPKFPDLATLRNLWNLRIEQFEELKEIPTLQELKSLKLLSISGCKSLENLPDFSEFTYLRHLNAEGCEKLVEFRGLENLNSFIRLYIYGCRSLKQLPKLRNGRIYKRKEYPWQW